MKKILMASLLLMLAACGQSSQESDLSALPKKAYIFAVDNRPVDGSFDRLTIVKSKLGTFDAKFRVITAGDGFPISDTTEDLGSNLKCVEQKRGKILAKLICSRDDRPVDGPLVELTLTRNPQRTFDAVLRTVITSRLLRKEIVEKKDFAYGLVRIK